MDLQGFVNDLLQLMYLLILFIYACLIPNRFLFSIPNDRGWKEYISVEEEGKMAD